VCVCVCVCSVCVQDPPRVLNATWTLRIPQTATISPSSLETAILLSWATGVSWYCLFFSHLILLVSFGLVFSHCFFLLVTTLQVPRVGGWARHEYHPSDIYAATVAKARVGERQFRAASQCHKQRGVCKPRQDLVGHLGSVVAGSRPVSPWGFLVPCPCTWLKVGSVCFRPFSFYCNSNTTE
jgi:hypothetical protein